MKKILIAAMTIDGKISKSTTASVDWTSKEDKKFFSNHTRDAGVVIFGSQTFKTIKKPLPGRLNLIMTRDPSRYADLVQPGLLEFTCESPKQIVENLERKKYGAIVIGGGQAIYSLFLQSRMVDEIYITIAPRLFGQGIPFVMEIDYSSVRLQFKNLQKFEGGEILLHYEIEYHDTI